MSVWYTFKYSLKFIYAFNLKGTIILSLLKLKTDNNFANRQIFKLHFHYVDYINIKLNFIIFK